MQYSFRPRPQSAIDMIVNKLTSKDIVIDLQVVVKGEEVIITLPTDIHQHDFQLAFNMGRVVGALEVQYQVQQP